MRLSPLRLEIVEWQQSFMEWCEGYAKNFVIERSWELTLMFIWKSLNARNSWVFKKWRTDPFLACARTMSFLGEFEAEGERDGAPPDTVSPLTTELH